ncbi:MAG: hypothetical protein ACRELG_22300 [Gemmataceae bacterium]
MVLGTTYYNAARSAAGMGWNRPGSLLVFRNACLALLALVAAVVAGDAGSTSTTKAGSNTDSAVPERLPSLEMVATPTTPPSANGRKPTAPPAAAKEPTSVLLPPIQFLPTGDAISSSAQSRATRSSSNRQMPPSLLEPPPSLKRADKPETDTILEVIVGQPRVLTFPDVPHRVALIVNETDPIATLKEVPHRPREWYLMGKKPGTTFLDVWLPDPSNTTSHRVLHYQVRMVAEGTKKEVKIAEKPPTVKPYVAKLPTVKPYIEKPPTAKPYAAKPPIAKPYAAKPPIAKPYAVKPYTANPRVEPLTQAPIYQTLEQEINKTFSGSTVHLKQVGEMLVVSGNARNLFEALRILSLARAHAPGGTAGEPGRTPPALPTLQAMLDNYAHAGGPHVVNLLRIPGEQQIMLRVIVAEVNRSAARSLGLDFGIADKQATVLPSRPTGSEGSSTVDHNGWIGEVLRTLQDLHYAQTLAEPTLTTLNGQAASFQAGGEFPIPVVSPSSQGTVQGVAFRSYGVQLSIQPVVADLDRIRLAVDAQVSGTDPQAAMQVGGAAVPGLKVRNFQSTVELREGETLAVAGLVRGATGSPLPQNVRPGVVNPASSEQELVVLISPLLLHPPGHEGGREGGRLNPQEIEMYLRSRNTMVPRGDALYLIGPQGYAGKQKR